MVKMSAIYMGEKHCTAKHEPSNSILETDAPKDNQGLGESFSPTDLVATSLGTCMLTTMAIFAEKEGLNLKNSKMHVEKIMASNPRRIESLKTIIELPQSLTPEKRNWLEQIALNCPVKISLNPNIQIPVEFKYNIL